MIGPNMLDQKGNNTRKIFSFLPLAKAVFSFNFSEYAVFKKLHATLFM